MSKVTIHYQVSMFKMENGLSYQHQSVDGSPRQALRGQKLKGKHHSVIKCKLASQAWGLHVDTTAHCSSSYCFIGRFSLNNEITENKADFVTLHKMKHVPLNWS